MTGFAAALGREIRLAVREPGEATAAVMFFVLATVLFPFGVGPDANLLARIAAGVLWVAQLLGPRWRRLSACFRGLRRTEVCEVLALRPPLPPFPYRGERRCWTSTELTTVSRDTMATPLMAVLLDLDASGYLVLVAAMTLGTPTIGLIGGVGAALTLGARRGGVLLSILVLPLLIPVLIFGAGAVDAAIAGHAVRPQLMILGAMFLAAAALCPWAAAAAVRQALE